MVNLPEYQNGAVADLCAEINQKACKVKLFVRQKSHLVLASPLQYVHGGNAGTPSVAVWVPPDVVLEIAAGTISVDNPDIVWICQSLVQLGELLPTWATESDIPNVLYYPTSAELKSAQAMARKGGVHVNTSDREQALHVDQGVACPRSLNFTVPSDGRPFTEVVNITPSRFIRLLHEHPDTIEEELARIGFFKTDLVPNGKLALAFSSGTPHRGLGGNSALQTSTIFFAGAEAPATQLVVGGPAHLLQTGTMASGAARPNCAGDAVVPVSELDALGRALAAEFKGVRRPTAQHIVAAFGRV